MASLLKHSPTVLWAYLRRGEAGLSDYADRLHDQAHDRPGGKFSKRRAVYLPQTPFPPDVWRSCCERCRFWKEGEDGGPGACHIVGLEDDPFGGAAIHPRGVCGFFVPPAEEPAFAWLRERLDPTGADLERGAYRPDLADRRAESPVEVPITDGDEEGDRSVGGTGAGAADGGD